MRDEGRTGGAGGDWDRRDFVTALGAGAMAAAVPIGATAQQDPPKVTCYFEGAILIIPDATNRTVEVRIPLAETAGKHSDGTGADAHYAHLATFRTFQAGDGPGKVVKLRGKDLRIAGQDLGTPLPNFGRFVSVSSITVNPALVDLNVGAVHATRLVLRGGRFSIPEYDEGEWSFSNVLNSGAPQRVKLASRLVWETGLEEMVITDSSGQVIEKLKAKKRPIAVFGHYPEPPEKWPEHHEPTKAGDFDNHFKWLYRITKPTTAPSWEELLKENGIPAKLLPAPYCVVAPARLRPEGRRYVGSPTCFGGLFP